MEKSRTQVLQKLESTGVVVIIRMTDTEKVLQVFDAFRAGGVTCIEIAMTTPNAIELIQAATNRASEEMCIGVGTVLDAETARMAILAGAEYVVTPNTNPNVIQTCKRYGKVVVPGALTPTEIVSAWEAGGDIIKIFPATTFGPGYIKDLRGPLPHIKYMPTGGVNEENAGDFIKAGAVAVGVGSALLDKEVIQSGNFNVLTQKAKHLTERIQSAKR